jgi:integrase
VYISVYIECTERRFQKSVHGRCKVGLTDAWLKANCDKERSVVLEKADRDGLSVRVTQKGKVVFQMRYRYDGSANPKRLDLGSYPRMALKDARAESERLRGELEQGHDPAVVRLLEKRAIARAETLEGLFRLWYLNYCSKQKEGHNEILRSFELYVFPRIGALPATKVTLHHWLDLLEEQAEQRPGICERVLTNAKQMLKWGVKRKLIPANVLADIYAKEDFQVDDNEEEHRSLSDEEVNRVWRAIERSRMTLKNKIFLKLCLFYGCRNGELRRSQKVDFDFNKQVWTVPTRHNKVRKKTGKPILRPIIPEIEPLIRQAIALGGSTSYVFSNAGTDEPMGKGAPLQLPYNLMQWLRRHEKYEMEHWSVHDLRKTARTNFSSLTEPHIAEIMLGHKLPKNWRIYDHYTYMKEQASAYRAWWQRLMTLTGENFESARAPSTPTLQPVLNPTS